MTADIARAPSRWGEASQRRPGARRGRRNHTLCPTTGKRRFRDQHDAGLELERLGHRRSSLDAQGLAHAIRVVRAYPCDHCGGWHLTSRPRLPAAPTPVAA